MASVRGSEGAARTCPHEDRSLVEVASASRSVGGGCEICAIRACARIRRGPVEHPLRHIASNIRLTPPSIPCRLLAHRHQVRNGAASHTITYAVRPIKVARMCAIQLQRRRGVRPRIRALLIGGRCHVVPLRFRGEIPEIPSISRAKRHRLVPREAVHCRFSLAPGRSVHVCIPELHFYGNNECPGVRDEVCIPVRVPSAPGEVRMRPGPRQPRVGLGSTGFPPNMLCLVLDLPRYAALYLLSTDWASPPYGRDFIA